MAFTQEQIDSLLKTPDEVVALNNELIESIELKNNEYKAKFANFIKTTFEGLVNLENVNISIGLLLEECVFNEPVVLKNIQAEGYNELYNSESQSIYFKDCIFSQIVQIGGKNTKTERGVLFEGCIFHKGIEIDGLEIPQQGLAIRNCTINEKCDIFHVQVQQDISLTSNTINAFTRIELVKCASLTILGTNVFSDRLLILNCMLERGIVFNNGIFKNEVKLHEIEITKSGLTIIGSHFENIVFVKYDVEKSLTPETQNKQISSFYIRDVHFLNGIYINGEQSLADSLLPKSIVEEIILDVSPELKGNISFENFRVDKLELKGYNISSNIFFNHLYLREIKIKNFINNGSCVINNIKAYSLQEPQSKELNKNTIFEVSDSNLGNAQFSNTNFNLFEKLHFFNSSLVNLSVSNVQWFDPEKLDQDLDDIKKIKQGNNTLSLRLRMSWRQSYLDAKESKEKNLIRGSRSILKSIFQNHRETYRQLKLVMQKQGNAPQALEFQRLEMDYYRKVIIFSDKKGWSEYFILWSSQSNDFGQNWIKAVLLFMLFSFIIYMPIGFLCSSKLNYLRFASSWSDILINLKVIFFDNLKKWFVIMNPTHSLKDISQNIDIFSPWIYFWDFISRIIVSYFLFQIISAFRKFNK